MTETWVESPSRIFRVAAPPFLTVVGVVVGAIPAVRQFELEPYVVSTGILPLLLLLLLYAAARQVPFVDFRRSLRVIGFLAIVLVVASAVLLGVVVSLIWALTFALGIALGAVVVTSVAKRLGLPPRIVTILECEGLVNDATGLDDQSRGRLGGLKSNLATLLSSAPRRCIISSMSC